VAKTWHLICGKEVTVF